MSKGWNQLLDESIRRRMSYATLLAQLQQRDDTAAIRQQLEARRSAVGHAGSGQADPSAVQEELATIRKLLEFLALAPEQQQAVREQQAEAERLRGLEHQRWHAARVAAEARERALERWARHEVQQRHPTARGAADDPLQALAAAVASPGSPRARRPAPPRRRAAPRPAGDWQTAFVFVVIGSFLLSILLLGLLAAAGAYQGLEEGTSQALLLVHLVVIPFAITVAWTAHRTRDLPPPPRLPARPPEPLIVNARGLGWDGTELQISMRRAQGHQHDLGRWLAGNFTPEEHVRLDVDRLRELWELVSRNEWDPKLTGPPLRTISEAQLARFRDREPEA